MEPVSFLASVAYTQQSRLTIKLRIAQLSEGARAQGAGRAYAD